MIFRINKCLIGNGVHEIKYDMKGDCNIKEPVALTSASDENHL